MENKVVSGIENGSRKRRRSLGRQCVAYGCSNFFYRTDGSPSGHHFFKFPQANPAKSVWCNRIKRVDGKDGFKVTNSSFLCDKHFLGSDIKKNPNRWSLRQGAVPSLNLRGAQKPKSSRKSPTKRQLMPSSASASSLPEYPDEEHASVSYYSCSLPFVSVSAQTDFSYVNSVLCIHSANSDQSDPDLPCYDDDYVENDLLNMCRHHESLASSVSSLKQHVNDLEQQLVQLKRTLFSLEKLRDDDAAVKFYTGFPNFGSLNAVFEYFEPKLECMQYWRGRKTSGNPDLSYQQASLSSKPGPFRSLSHLEEFVLVLMRLRVGLFMHDLADRFGIPSGHASKIFTTWINFLFHELPLLFPFPSQERIRKNMPKQFKEYPTTRMIIDCTEIFSQVPSSLKSQSRTWSEYKHHNTWKALIGISPTGCITFVSKLWSGRVSDKEITAKSGVLRLLEDGDNLMADRGFDISDILPAGVTLNIPPFKGSRPQLTAQEVEDTARIAAVRIHVERAIGCVKNYHILDGVMPLSLQPLLNQIFFVCCLLANFQPFLVSPP